MRGGSVGVMRGGSVGVMRGREGRSDEGEGVWE